jgi:hypothetical protein
MITHIVIICVDVNGSSRTSVSRSSLLVTLQELVPNCQTHLKFMNARVILQNFAKRSSFVTKRSSFVTLFQLLFMFSPLPFLSLPDTGFLGIITTLKIKNKQIVTEIRA